VDRTAVIQAALDATGRGNYLEIGVCTGESFIPLKARRKWGVDPEHYLSWKRIAKYEVFSRLGLKDERVFRQTSDEFFERQAQMLGRRGVDVAFVDGLHTYEQALRDVLSAVRRLRPGGIVLMHDCSPESEVAALPAASIAEVGTKNIPGWTGAWNGDVWKAVVHLRSRHHDLSVFVLDCDNGIGVVTRAPAQERLAYAPQDIQAMAYADLDRDRARLLGLRPPAFLDEFLAGRRR
jgi:hypothetical protein